MARANLNAAPASEATVYFLAKNIMLTSLFCDKLDCCVFRILGWHRMSSFKTCCVSRQLFCFLYICKYMTITGFHCIGSGWNVFPVMKLHEIEWIWIWKFHQSRRHSAEWLNFQFWVNFTPFSTSVVCFGFDLCFQPHTKKSLLLFNSSTSQHQYLLNIISWIEPLTPLWPLKKSLINLQCFHLRHSTFVLFNALPEA